jgi:hypothetical protein
MYLLVIFLLKVTCFSSYGIKNAGNRLSFGIHLYKNFFPVVFLPYVLPFNIRIPAKFLTCVAMEN